MMKIVALIRINVNITYILHETEFHIHLMLKRNSLQRRFLRITTINYVRIIFCTTLPSLFSFRVRTATSFKMKTQKINTFPYFSCRTQKTVSRKEKY